MKLSSIILLAILAYVQCEMRSSELAIIENKLKYFDELKQQFKSMEWRQEKNEMKINLLETKIKNQADNEEKIRKLEKLVLLQEKRIKKLELKISRSFIKELLEVHTVKQQTYVRQRQNKSSENITRSKKNIPQISSHTQNNDLKKKREISVENVAFYTYMSSLERNPGPRHILVFDVVKTNAGSGYNKNNGMFTVPSHGFYVFSWTIGTDVRSFISTEIVINSNVFGSVLTDSEEIGDYHTATGMVVAEVNQGDKVYIRTDVTATIRGSILSNTSLRSSFSGWKLF